MKNLTIHDREFLIECLGKGTPLPDDFKEKLFPTIHKEYELRYAGKMRKEDLLADQDGTFAVPLQVEKIYNGERQKYKDGWRNMIVFGDNLQFLKTCFANKDELIRNKVKGKVKLIYIDPPFATESDFKNQAGIVAYSDKTKGAEFVEYMRRRLVLAKEILADGGSIFVHLDQKKCHYIKVVLDEVFGEGNFRNEIVWKRTSAHSDSNKLGINIDYILYYTKGEQFTWNKLFEIYSDKHLARFTGEDHDGRKWTDGPLTAKGLKGAGYNYSYKGIAGYWRCPLETMKRLDSENRLYFTSKGGIRVKRYLDELEGMPLQALWDNIDPINSQSKERTSYPTQKPEELIERIVRIATNENDIVLDFFGGSGTTAAVAEKLNRKWITCDIGKFGFYTIQKRMLAIQESKDLENFKKLYGKEARTFVTVNTGIYDLKKMQELNQDKYIEFVLQLFEVAPMPKIVKGIKLHGERKDGYSVLVWDYWNHKDSAVDIFFLEQLHQNIGKRISKRLYIIAPANAVQFISDFHEIDDVRYYFLKIPYQIIRELHPKSFAKFRQPSSKNKINDLDNAIGFHFMLQPEVQSEFKNGKLIIKKFISNFREEETDKQLPNFESLSMVIIDEKFNGKDFMMSQCIFKEDIESKNGTMQIQLGKTGKQICVIYIDLYGNEFKETIKVK